MNDIESPKASRETEVFVLKERYTAPGNRASREHAERSTKTFAVACAITAGDHIRPDGFQRIIDGFDPTKSEVAFSVENLAAIPFEPFAGESITTAELMARLQDEKWLAENPTHPIAWMYWAIRNYAQLTKAIREQKPLMCFKRHKARAFVVVGGDPDRSARILKEAGFSETEIKEIFAKLP